MPTSVHIYENIENYMIYYPSGTDITNEVPIIDLWALPNNKIWVITNTDDIEVPVGLNTSMIHFRLGKIPDYAQDKERTLITGENLRFNYKKKRLELKGSDWFWQVDKYIGDKIKHPSKVVEYFSKHKKINYRYRFYDYNKNIINLILL